MTYRVYSFGFVRSPEYHQGGQPNYDNSRLGQAGVRSDWKRGRDEVTVQGDAYLGKLGDAQEIPSFVPAANTISYESTNTAGGNILGRWRRDLGPDGDLYLQAYWSIDRRLGPNFGEMRNTFDVDFLHRTPPTKYQQFTYGAGLRITPSTIQQTTQTLGFAPLQKTDSTYSGFVQEEVHILPGKLSLTVGTKLEHNNYTGFEYQPNGRVLWTPTPTTTIWLAASRAVRIPDRFVDDLNDYVLPDPPGAISPGSEAVYAQVIGNKDLRAERLISFELGYRALIHHRFYMDFAAFHNQYHDLIAQGPLVLAALPPITPPAPAPVPSNAGLFTLQYQNGIRGNTDGGEVGPDWQPTSWWQIKAAYSYLHVHLGYQPAFNDPMNVTLTTLRGSSPNSQAVLRSLINLPHKFEFDQTIRYVGPLPAQQVKAYVTGDLRAGYHNPHGFDLSVTGENLFQPHHGEFGITPGPNVLIKRSVYAKLVWTR
jgi:iron complex outermembrane recepter protein